MEALFTEAGRAGVEGYINDYVTCFCTEVGFDIADLRVPVAIWYGERDRNAPPEESRSTAAQIPGCALFGCADCGHFTPVAHWSEILIEVLRPVPLHDTAP